MCVGVLTMIGCLDAVGSLGGILMCCNKRVVAIKDSWIGCFSVSLLVKDLINNASWIVTAVYGSNDSSLRRNFWGELEYSRRKWY